MTFSLPLNSDCILQFLTDFSNFEYFNRLSCTQDCMSTLNGFILSNILDQLKQKCNIPKNFRDSIDIMRKNNNIVISRADKGGKVVVMNRVDYINKILSLLSDNDAYETVNSDPL